MSSPSRSHTSRYWLAVRIFSLPSNKYYRRTTPEPFGDLSSRHQAIEDKRASRGIQYESWRRHMHRRLDGAGLKMFQRLVLKPPVTHPSQRLVRKPPIAHPFQVHFLKIPYLTKALRLLGQSSIQVGGKESKLERTGVPDSAGYVSRQFFPHSTQSRAAYSTLHL